MTQPSRVLYLPPGVAAPGPSPITAPSGLPFDRTFFEQILPQAIAAFCKQIDCGDSPIVEVLTVDGTTHYVKGISGVADTWVALHTSEVDHQRPLQVFIPYATIFRVAVQPAADVSRHHLGFAIGEARVPRVEVSAAITPAIESAPATATTKKRRKS